MTKQLLLSGSYWVLNKGMVKLLGLESAFLLSNFAEAESMMADSDGWFYQTSTMVEEMTTLSRHKQDQCIQQLVDIGILERDVRGLPPKRYFRINYECLTNQFVENQQIDLLKIDKTICRKSATSKEHTNKELINKESTKANLSDSNVVNDFFERICILYPNKKGKSTISKTTKNKLFKVGEDKLKLAIEHYQKELSLETWKHPMNGSTFFNGRYTDYLQENIPEPKKVDLSLKKNDMSKWE